MTRFIRYCLIACVLSAVMFPHVTYAADKEKHTTYFFITVDTESLVRADFDLPDQVFTTINKVGCGLDEMMNIADRYNAKITFLFSVYEVHKFGEEKIKEIVKYIAGRGHDIQLHTDQPLTTGPEKLLNTYSLKEQIQIIREGRDLIFRWTGRYPVAHRAGTYAANDDTIVALQKNKFYIDSSFYYKNINNRFDEYKFNINGVTGIGMLLEVPVTVYQLNEYARLGDYKLPAKGRIKKLDLDSSDLDAMKKVVLQLQQNEIDTIVLFMHSWSLVKKWGSVDDRREADVTDIHELEEILKFVNTIPEIRISSTSDYWKKVHNNEIALSEAAFLPEITRNVGLVTYTRRVLGINRGNYLYWAAVISVIVISGILSVLALYIRLRGRRRS